MQFPIRYSKPMRLLLTVLGMGPRHSAVDLGEATIDVRMGWAFHVSIPRSSITGARHVDPVRFSRGAHGWGGRYLVNGAGDRLVAISADPPQRGLMVGFGVNVSDVTVSVDDPNALVAAIGNGSTQ
jgi:hypothetical protein